MQQFRLLCLATATGLVMSSLVHAGNIPNSTRTLTGGIGAGTATSAVPSSHPYASRSLGYTYSGHSRNTHADGSIDRFANGTSHRPDDSYLSGGSSMSRSSPPASIPAILPQQAAGHVPSAIGGSSASNPPPSAIPATLPGQAAGHVPATIGGGSAAGGVNAGLNSTPPSMIPVNIPPQAADRVPGSIGGVSMVTPPPTMIPANIPTQAAGRVPGSIGGVSMATPPPTMIPANIPAQATGRIPESIGGRP